MCAEEQVCPDRVEAFCSAGAAAVARLRRGPLDEEKPVTVEVTGSSMSTLLIASILISSDTCSCSPASAAAKAAPEEAVALGGPRAPLALESAEAAAGTAAPDEESACAKEEDPFWLVPAAEDVFLPHEVPSQNNAAKSKGAVGASGSGAGSSPGSVCS